MKNDERELLCIEKFTLDIKNAKKPALVFAGVIEGASFLMFIIILIAVILSPSAAGIIMAVMIGVLTAIGAFILIQTALLFKPDGVELVEDEVEYKADEAEDTKNTASALKFLFAGRYGRRRMIRKSMRHLIRFKNFGDYEYPAEENDVVFQLASRGDKFYLVVTKDKYRRILAIYDQRRYRI